MRVLVCGGRNYNDADTVFWELDSIKDVTHIIHGAATGADNQGRLWAQARDKVKHVPFEAKWKDLNVPGAIIKNGKYGPYNAVAGPQRNQRMIDEGKPDMVLAFPGNKGTLDMIRRAEKANIPVKRVQLEQNEKQNKD